MTLPCIVFLQLYRPAATSALSDVYPLNGGAEEDDGAGGGGLSGGGELGGGFGAEAALVAASSNEICTAAMKPRLRPPEANGFDM